MNRFYEAVHRGDYTKPNIELPIFIGDEKLETKIGCFEVFILVDNENQVKKLQCNVLLDCPQSSVLNIKVHPSLIYTNLPKNLLHQIETYDFKMHVTEEESIDKISRFTRNLDRNPFPYWESHNTMEGFIDSVKKSQQEMKSYLDNRKSCYPVYETIDLPEINKFQCRKFGSSQGKIIGIDGKGWYFSFEASIPAILQQIIYNNISHSTIEQFSGGQGANQKYIQ